MSQDYRVIKASHVGRSHIISFKNCQDASSIFDGVIRGRRVIVGIICDGCSEGNCSEVGAQLASAFLIRKTYSLLEQDVPVVEIPDQLYSALLESFRQVIGAYLFVSSGDLANFVKNTLLFTVVGFVITEEKTVVFYAGDGTIVVNEEEFFINADNRPSYPAYHLVDRSLLETNASLLPEGFEVLIYSSAEISRLAIGSDAWHYEKDLLDQIWGLVKPVYLQRKLNVWSNIDHRFGDDVTIITLERNCQPEGGDADASSD